MRDSVRDLETAVALKRRRSLPIRYPPCLMLFTNRVLPFLSQQSLSCWFMRLHSACSSPRTPTTAMPMGLSIILQEEAKAAVSMYQRVELLSPKLINLCKENWEFTRLAEHHILAPQAIHPPAILIHLAAGDSRGHIPRPAARQGLIMGDTSCSVPTRPLLT